MQETSTHEARPATAARGGADASAYWYPEGHEATAVDVLDLLRRYRAAESDMRARTRTSMQMNETDMVALRHLLRAQREGRVVRQRGLSSMLEISSASVTALVDRLERSGHVARQPHPTDRRAVVVVATPETDREVRETMGELHRRMIAVVDGMTGEQLGAVAQFLAGMVDAVEHASVERAPATATA